MTTFTIANLSGLPEVARSILKVGSGQRVFAFYAEMGAGKTTLIQAMLHEMGISETHGSPTYSLVNSYHSDKIGEVFHFDVYRLNSIEEAMDAGIEEMFHSGATCLIEWAEKVESLLPESYLRVEIAVNEQNEREVSVKIVGN